MAEGLKPGPERGEKSKVLREKLSYQGWESEIDLLGEIQQHLAARGLLSERLLLSGHVAPSEGSAAIASEEVRQQTLAVTMQEYEAILHYNHGYSPLFYAETAPKQENSTPTISVYDPDKLQLVPHEAEIYTTHDGSPLHEALLAEFDVSEWVG